MGDLREKLDVVDWSTLEPEFNKYLDWSQEQMKAYVESLPPEALSRRKPVRVVLYQSCHTLVRVFRNNSLLSL